MKYFILISLLILANALCAQEPVSATITLSVSVVSIPTADTALTTDSLKDSSDCASLDAEEAVLELPEGCNVFVVETVYGDHVQLTLKPL